MRVTAFSATLIGVGVSVGAVLGSAGCQQILGDFTLAPAEGGSDATTVDTGAEASSDAGIDGAIDATVEAGADVDSRAGDASGDTARSADAAGDATADAPPEAPADAPAETLADAPVDAPAEATAEAAVPCSGSTPNPCGGTCTNLTSDPGNCGRCGHSCQGGQCTASSCQPIPILSPTYYPTALAVDSTSVYWVETQDASQVRDNGSVKKAPLAGGGGYTVLSGQQGAPFALAVGASGVFWLNAGATNPGGLMWMSQGATSPTAVATAYTSPTGGVVLTSSNVFWFDTTMTAAQSENLLGLPLTGLTASAIPTIDVAIAACVYAPPTLHGSTLYWMQSGCFANSGTLWSLGLPFVAGTAPTALLPSGTFLNGPYAAARIATDSSSIYIGANNSSQVASIESVALGGGNLSVVFSASPNGVAMDATNFYWTDSQALAVESRPIAGGSVTTLASGQSNPWDIAVDATSVYFTNNASPGSVMKVAKP